MVKAITGSRISARTIGREIEIAWRMEGDGSPVTTAAADTSLSASLISPESSGQKQKRRNTKRGQLLLSRKRSTVRTKGANVERNSALPGDRFAGLTQT